MSLAAWPGPSASGVSASRTGAVKFDGGVLFRIEDRHHVGAVLGASRTLAVGIDRRVAPIRGDQVVQVMLVVEPIPGRDDDVALDALRPRRLRMGQLALGDAVRPVREVAERRGAELFDERG